MIFLPEVQIYELTTGLIDHLKLDYEANAGDPSKSMLNYIFGSLSHVKKDYYKDAIDLFTRGNKHPRKITTRMYFDAEVARSPTIHITTPQEQHGQQSIGGEDGVMDIDITAISTEYRNIFTRRFEALTQIVITSDNESEVTTIYHALRAMLISAFNTISLKGIENPKLSGQAMDIKEHLAPNHLYYRGLGIQYSYCVEVPEWYNSEQLNNMILCRFEQDPANTPKLIDDGR